MSEQFQDKLIAWMAKVDERLKPIPEILAKTQELIIEQTAQKTITHSVIDRIEKIEEQQQYNQEHRLTTKGAVKLLVPLMGWMIALISGAIALLK